MKKIVEKYLKHFGKYQKILESAENPRILDLTKPDRKDYFCLHNSQINKFAKESPETLACTLIFVLTTIRTNWAQVYFAFPKIIAILTKHSSIEHIFKSDFQFKDSFYRSIIFGFKIKAIDYIWENRKSIYNKVTSILDVDEDMDRDFVLYDYFVKNLHGLSTPKAAFAVQLITGKYGCIDSVNTQMYGKVLGGEYLTSTRDLDKKMQEYVSFLEALKKNTFNLDSAKLWNNWCDIVGHKMYYSLPKKKEQLIIKINDDLAPIINTYNCTMEILKYKKEFPDVDGEKISKQHLDLLSRNTFKESVSIPLKEDYPSNFDFDYLQSLNNLKDIVKYCTSKLGRPKKGSSRLVYLVDDKTVLKVAYNQVGLAQNYGERDGSKQEWYSQLLAKVFRYDEDRLVWIEMERVKPIKNENQMKKFLGGYTLNDIKTYIENHQTCKNCPPEKQKMYDFFAEDEFILELVDFLRGYDMALGDALHYSHWGTVMRDGEEQAVLMDYGLNRQDWNYHYDRGVVKKEFKHGRLESNNE